MRTFSDLLKEYTGRTGISDAELARAVGVQRQTIFRWKEGTVGRPRAAEDVFRLAAKLRLTPAERDELLLAAGFPPVASPAGTTESLPPSASVDIPPDARAPSLEHVLPDNANAAASRRTRRSWTAAALAVAALVLAAAAVIFFKGQHLAYPQAASGERLIVVAQFGNYTGGEQGYNVAGRLTEALQRELMAAGLKDARPAVWPVAVTDEKAASSVLRQSKAALLIFGEYDSGRVVARFLPRDDPNPAPRELSLLTASPEDLPAVINSALPGDIRYLALFSLAQVYLHEGKPEAARAALAQAGLNLPTDAGTGAAHYFLWGYANQVSQPPDLDAAIQGYTEALKIDDGLDAAHNNRAVAYLGRRAPGDLDGAVDDLTRYLAKHEDDAAARNNRGSAYFLLGGSDNAARALADFNVAVARAPEDTAGYYNRGLVYVRLDNGPMWRADLQRALEGQHPGANQALCWGYSLSEEPEKAVDYCREALKTGGDPGPWENLGVAYARTGQYAEAADALAKYEAELGKPGVGAPPAKEAQLAEWLAALRVGKDPFDEETLKRLREE